MQGPYMAAIERDLNPQPSGRKAYTLYQCATNAPTMPHTVWEALLFPCMYDTDTLAGFVPSTD